MDSNKHKHHDLIVAWANGAEIESWDEGHWYDCKNPDWETHVLYRVKGAPVIKYQWVLKGSPQRRDTSEFITPYFYSSTEDIKRDYPSATVVQRADWTKIVIK